MPRFLLVVLFAILGGVAHAQSDGLSDSDWADRWACGDGDIEACTRIIDAGRGSDQELSNAFFHRGMAHFGLVVDDLTAEESEAVRGKVNAADDEAHLAPAESDLTWAIRLSPTMGGRYGVRGAVRWWRGNNAEAIADFRRALELAPGDAWAKEGLRALGVEP